MSTISRRVVPVLGAILTLVCGSAAARNGEWQPNEIRRCRPEAPVTIVWATSAPDAGGIEPDRLVAVGSRVQLHGSAARQTFDERCRPRAPVPLAFRWELRFQPEGPGPIEAITSSLIDRTTDSPKFKADRPGLYVAEFSAASRKQAVRILAVPRPVAWVPVGPSGVADTPDEYASVGRINLLLSSSSGATLPLFAGSAQGGAHRFSDATFGWHAISEFAGLPAAEVSGMAWLGDALYLGVGETGIDRGTNVFGEAGRGLLRLSAGTWTAVQPGAAGCTAPTIALPGRITRLRSRPYRFVPLTRWELIASTTSGLFRSIDGGGCWTRLPAGTDAVWDVGFVPGDTSTLVAVSDRTGFMRIEQYRGTAPTATPAFSPFASGIRIYGRFASGSATIYAIASDADAQSSASLLVSDNGGSTWQTRSAKCTRQCAADPALAVDPRNDNIIYHGEVDPWVSLNRGLTFQSLGDFRQGHDDFHDFLIDAASNTVWAATDGGIFQLRLSAPGVAATFPGWVAVNRGLQTNQAATVSTSDGEPVAAVVGSWDNGTLRRTLGLHWQQPLGGDGEQSGIGSDAAGNSVSYGNSNAGQDSRVLRDPGDTFVGTSAGFRTNPHVPGQLWFLRNSSEGEGAAGLYVSTNASSGSSATWMCADPAPGTASGPYGIAFAKDGFVGLIRWDGSLSRFKLGSSASGATSCTSGAATDATDVEVIAAAGTTTTAGAIAFDPRDSNRLLVVMPGHTTLDARIQRFTRDATAGTWTAEAIAGGVATELRDRLTQAIAFEPLEPIRNRFYVGTQRGVLQGSVDSAGAISWGVAPDGPDSWVSDIQQVGSRITLATYGRGIWERRFFPRPCDFGVCSTLVQPMSFCLVCQFRAGTSSQPGDGSSAVWIVALPADDRLLRSSDIGVLPGPSDASREVATRVAWMDAQSGVLVIELALASQSREIATRIDALRLWDRNAADLAPRVLPIKALLRRDRVGLLSVRAVEQRLAERPLPTALRVDTHQPGAKSFGNGEYAIPVGGSVRISAPKTASEGREFREFRVTEADRVFLHRETRLEFTIRDDTLVEAVYVQAPQPRPE